VWVSRKGQIAPRRGSHAAGAGRAGSPRRAACGSSSWNLLAVCSLRVSMSVFKSLLFVLVWFSVYSHRSAGLCECPWPGERPCLWILLSPSPFS